MLLQIFTRRHLTLNILANDKTDSKIKTDVSTRVKKKNCLKQFL